MEYIFRTSRKERVSFALFMAGQGLIGSFAGSYIQVFFTGAGITAMTVALIFLIARIWDAVNDPLFGAVADRSRLKGGRFLPWLRLSSALAPLFMLLIFVMPSSLSPGVKTFWAASAYILYGMAYTVCDVPVFSMFSAITDQVQERVTIMSRNFIAGVIAALIAVAVSPQIYPRFGWLPAALCAAIPAAALMFFFPRHGKERYVNKDAEKATLKSIFRFVKSNKYLLIFFSGLTLMNFTAATRTVGVYFAAYCLGDPALVPVTVGSIGFLTVVMALFLPLLTRRFDKFHIFLFSAIASGITGVIIFFAGYENRALFFTLLFIRGVFWGTVLITQMMFTGDLVEYGEYKTGKRFQGTAYSLQTFTFKFFSALAASAAMFILGLAGFAGGAGAVQSENTVRVIWMLFSLFPAAGIAVSLPVLLHYRLRDRDVQIMARRNSGEISREDAEKLFSHPY